MKFFAKIGAIIASAAIMLSCSIFASNNFSMASQDSGKTYLVPANYTSSEYNISDGNGGFVNQYNLYKNQERTATRPLDSIARTMMPGASFTLLVDNFNQGEVICNVAQRLIITQNDSVNLYIYFSLGHAHNFVVTLKDERQNGVYWSIEASHIDRQLDSGDSITEARKGWIMLELPIADISGFIGCGSLAEVDQISTITFNYSTPNLDTEGDYGGANYYAYCNIYAPYIQTSKTSKITFSGHQPYYNIDAKVGENLNSFCVGESLTIGSLSSTLNYCIIGELDVLAHNVSSEDYKFTLRIGPLSDLDDYKEYPLSYQNDVAARKHKFDEQGRYRATIIVNDIKAGTSTSSSVFISVNPFVGIYLSSNPTKLTKGETYNYTINLGSAVTSLQNINVTSSNSKVASVKILNNGNLQVTTTGNGDAKITISGSANTIHGDGAKAFDVSYKISVSTPKTTNWVAIAFGAIGIALAIIIIYFIMRKRRLIKGRYPKY